MLGDKIGIKMPVPHIDQLRAFRQFEKYPRFQLRAGRRWGKNIFFEMAAVNTMLDGGIVGIFAPDYKILSETFNELADMIAPIKKSSSKVEGVMRTITGGRCDFWTLDNPRAGRSRSYDLVIFDEAAFAKNDVEDIWERSIEPTLLDRGGRAIFASNANMLDEDNWFYKIYKNCGGASGVEFPRKAGYGQYHAPTRNNPHVPARMPGESEAEHAIRRLATIEKIRAEKHPLQFKAEYEAEFIDFSGVAFFERDKFLEVAVIGEPAQPVAFPASCGGVYATIDTATKTNSTSDGTGVCYWAITPPGQGPYPLILLDWDLVQIEGALLETWLPTVFQRLEGFAQQTRARAGSLGAWIEDKSSGMVLLQHAKNKGWPARPIDSKLTSMGKSERAISVSGYVYQGKVKISRPAYEKVVVYKGASRNHFLEQMLAFRVGEDQKDRQDDLLDAGCYGIACGIGAASGF